MLLLKQKAKNYNISIWQAFLMKGHLLQEWLLLLHHNLLLLEKQLLKLKIIFKRKLLERLLLFVIWRKPLYTSLANDDDVNVNWSVFNQKKNENDDTFIFLWLVVDYRSSNSATFHFSLLDVIIFEKGNFWNPATFNFSLFDVIIFEKGNLGNNFVLLLIICGKYMRALFLPCL